LIIRVISSPLCRNLGRGQNLAPLLPPASKPWWWRPSRYQKVSGVAPFLVEARRKLGSSAATMAAHWRKDAGAVASGPCWRCPLGGGSNAFAPRFGGEVSCRMWQSDGWMLRCSGRGDGRTATCSLREGMHQWVRSRAPGTLAPVQDVGLVAMVYERFSMYSLAYEWPSHAASWLMCERKSDGGPRRWR
jgi:hypothetical protein